MGGCCSISDDLSCSYYFALPGGMTVASAALGTLAGGAIVTYFKVTPVGCAKLILLANFLNLFSPIAGLFLGCPTPHIIGFHNITAKGSR